MKLSTVIEQLVEEKGLDQSLLADIIAEGILTGYEKKYPDLNFKVEHDKKSDEIQVFVEKSVASTPVDESEISLRKARFIDNSLEVGDTVWVPFEGKIGRIEILRAKQVIANKIAQVESDAIYRQFKDKEGAIVYGVIHKCERGGASIKVDDVLAFLPKSLSIPNSKCIVGYSVRALLKEVLPEPRNDNQLILDRVSDVFLKKLFELEIPEVFEKIVEIKKIVRIPGYKSKVIVVSNDPNIDPIGTCVGMGGARIKPILKDLDGEKIDIITWSDSPEQLVKDSLKPAQINRVEITDEEARVWLDEDQRSLAIGKMGKNIALASQLVDKPIVLMPSVEKKDEILEVSESS